MMISRRMRLQNLLEQLLVLRKKIYRKFVSYVVVPILKRRQKVPLVFLIHCEMQHWPDARCAHNLYKKNHLVEADVAAAIAIEIIVVAAVVVVVEIIVAVLVDVLRSLAQILVVLMKDHGAAD